MNVVPAVPNGAALYGPLDAQFAVTPMSASGAVIVSQGLVLIVGGSALALTLAAAPTGLPSAGGGDGQLLRFVSTTAYAHTISTPANGIGGGKHLATFTATVGSFITLVAYQGVWYALAQQGVTLS